MKTRDVTSCASFHDLSVIPKMQRVKCVPQALPHSWIPEAAARLLDPHGNAYHREFWCWQAPEGGEILPWIKSTHTSTQCAEGAQNTAERTWWDARAPRAGRT